MGWHMRRMKTVSTIARMMIVVSERMMAAWELSKMITVWEAIEMTKVRKRAKRVRAVVTMASMMAALRAALNLEYTPNEIHYPVLQKAK